jgi:radical SAM protein (TIGR01212 family)
MERGWSGLPFNPISEFYKQRFGGKTYKLPVSVVETCPNREGLKGMTVCSFCDVWGSAAHSESFQMELKTQIELYKERLAAAFNTSQFLVYFQAYTNSFAKVEKLKAQFELGLSYPFVKGFVVGTRPDCLSPGLFNLWQEIHEKSFVAVELGAQSFFEDDLKFYHRGHSFEDTRKALKRIDDSTDVDLGVHLMFGSPFETLERVRETARICNDLPITNVKLHNLHVLKNTTLEKWHAEGTFKPIELQDYADRVSTFLSELSPRIYVHRLAAYSSRRDELIAPDWTKDKMRSHQFIIDKLRAEKIHQGSAYQALNQLEETLKRKFADSVNFKNPN